MNVHRMLERLGRAQRTTRFRVIVSALWFLLCASAFGGWVVTVYAPNHHETQAQAPSVQSQQQSRQDQAVDAPSKIIDNATIQDRVQDAQRALHARSALPAIAIGAAVVMAVGTTVIWLGLALTYSGLGVLALGATSLLSVFAQTQELAFIVGSVVGLAAMYSAFFSILEAAFSGRSPTMAVARNVLAEASRLRVSMGLTLLVLFWLSAVPLWLDSGGQLRYRVQSFLQYSVSGTFWIAATLTLFFAAATVAFEQRDKTIWQTLTKPIAPWQYLLGKWIGVMGINLALLTTVALGVFLYTEYLRQQPAAGETKAFVNLDGSDGRMSPSPDRLILESQVLTARVGEQATPQEIPEDVLRQTIEQRLQEEYTRDPSLRDDKQFRNEVQAQVLKEVHEQRWAVPPPSDVGFASVEYIFKGLQKARQRGKPLTLRYKIRAAGDDPSTIYHLLFVIAGAPVPAEAVLNSAHTIPLRAQAIDDDGVIRMQVFNGNPITGETNPWTMRFEPGSLEVLYPAGSYEANFVRVMLMLWIKLGFVAAVAIGSSTFLSFPIACLLTAVVLFAAETTGFVETALKQWTFYNREGHFDPVAAPIRIGAMPAVLAFRGYASIKPTASLVDGRLVSTASLLKAIGLVGGWIIATLGLGWIIFRKRELATYSGH